MAKKLNTFVHVVELDDNGNQTGRAGTFGPDDTVPNWARNAITNKDVWTGDGSDEETAPERPRGNASRDVWAHYARTLGISVSDDMDRDAIRAAVDAAGE